MRPDPRNCRAINRPTGSGRRCISPPPRASLPRDESVRVLVDGGAALSSAKDLGLVGLGDGAIACPHRRTSSQLLLAPS